MPALPPFHADASTVTAAELGASWHAGCPVGPSQLRTVSVSYVGFDGRAHTGRIVVNADVVGDVETVFRRLYAARFPIRHMEPVAGYGGSDNRSMAADNTSGFNCRYAVALGAQALVGACLRRGDRRQHGREPVPRRRPRAAAGGRAYLDRSRYRRGMAVAGGVLVRAFASVGWLWGGRWTALARLAALLQDRRLSSGRPCGRRGRGRGTASARRARAGSSARRRRPRRAPRRRARRRRPTRTRRARSRRR